KGMGKLGQELTEKIEQGDKAVLAEVTRVEKDLGNKIEQGDKATQAEIIRVEKGMGKLGQELTEKIEQGDKAVMAEVTRVEKAVTAEVTRVEKTLEKTLGDRITCVERELAVHSWMLRTIVGMVAALIIKSFWPIW
ncbi:MAG: hypothetical protein OXC07_03915, partial [Kistimonas sp.]|nr:hypothetical protein [Kistimonas sp.]